MEHTPKSPQEFRGRDTPTPPSRPADRPSEPPKSGSSFVDAVADVPKTFIDAVTEVLSGGKSKK